MGAQETAAEALRAALSPAQAADKRERLLRAAFGVIGEQGYEQASVARIARAAEMAPGLVHYYFDSKDDLLVAVADWCGHLFDGVLDELDVETDPVEMVRTRVQQVQQIVHVLPGWYVVRRELLALAVRRPLLREALARLEHDARERVAVVFRRAVLLDGRDPTDPAVDRLAAAVLGAFDGLADQALVDPAFDLAGAYEQLAEAAVAALLPTGDRR